LPRLSAGASVPHLKPRQTSELEAAHPGIQKAKAAGKYKGRKRKVTAAKITELKTKGLTMAAIARELGVSRQAVYKAMN
jgi:DNA invertase Pin-like site-specific DNA recombinase